MSVRYSFGGFTTRGHGVIEYADPHPIQDGQKKRKRRKKIDSKFATRWPSAKPLKLKSSTDKLVPKISVEKKAWEIFKQRHPGQQPKKGQIKIIMKELSGKPRSTLDKNQARHAKSQNKNTAPTIQSPLDKLTLAMFAKRHPGNKPTKKQLVEIKLELAAARRKLGL